MRPVLDLLVTVSPAWSESTCHMHRAPWLWLTMWDGPLGIPELRPIWWRYPFVVEQVGSVNCPPERHALESSP
jgi:hypothetical protein